MIRSRGYPTIQARTDFDAFLSDHSDSDATLREFQGYFNPHVEHFLACCHMTMQLTVLQQTAKGLPDQQ